MTDNRFENAFPQEPIKGMGRGSKGLTKREYFVAAALTGMCANPHYNGKDVAKEARDLADRLLDQLL